jgi:diketogulonate reductase-like aldo/keto reductase
MVDDRQFSIFFGRTGFLAHSADRRTDHTSAKCQILMTDDDETNGDHTIQKTGRDEKFTFVLCLYYYTSIKADTGNNVDKDSSKMSVLSVFPSTIWVNIWQLSVVVFLSCLQIQAFRQCIILVPTHSYSSNIAATRNSYFSQTKMQASKLYNHERDPASDTKFDLNEGSQENIVKNPASTFWYSREALVTPSETDIMPHQPHLDKEGPLPIGSYKRIGRTDIDVKPTCVTSIGLDPFHVGGGGNGNVQAEDINVESVISTLHKYIDSGFTSFQMVTPPCSPARKGMEPSWTQTWTEQCIFAKLVRDTPNSVLNECNFASKIAIPHLDYDLEANGNGMSLRTMVRQRVGDSIRNVYGRSDGCLDTLQVDFRALDGVNDAASPLTFDVLDVLFDMQREGLIRSISGLNFYASAMEEADKMGFDLDSNQVSCNLLDPTRYANDMYPFFERLSDDSNTRRICLSSPLAGGLLNEKFMNMNIPDAWKNKQGRPIPAYMSARERRHYTKLNAPKKASRYGFMNKILGTMADVAAKHEVSISSVALRWTMQLDHVGSIVIASGLNINGDRNDLHLRRQRDLRELFSFHLDEEDMEVLWEVTDIQVDHSQKVGLDLEEGMPFDLSDTRFFL